MQCTSYYIGYLHYNKLLKLVERLIPGSSTPFSSTPFSSTPVLSTPVLSTPVLSTTLNCVFHEILVL